MHGNVFLEQRDGAAQMCFGIIIGAQRERRHGLYHSAQAIRARHIARHARPRDAFHQHFYRAGTEPRELPDTSHHADAIQVGGRGLLRFRIALRDEEHEIVRLAPRLQRSKRRRPSDEQRHGHVRKHHDVAQWKNGKTVGRRDDVAVNGKGGHDGR